MLRGIRRVSAICRRWKRCIKGEEPKRAEKRKKEAEPSGPYDTQRGGPRGGKAGEKVIFSEWDRGLRRKREKRKKSLFAKIVEKESKRHIHRSHRIPVYV